MVISAIVKSQRLIFIASKLPILGVRPNSSHTFEHILLKSSRYYGRYICSMRANFHVHICSSKITSYGFLILFCFFSVPELINHWLFHKAKWNFMELLIHIIILYANFHAGIRNNSTVSSGFLSVWAKCGYLTKCYSERHQRGTMPFPTTISVPSCTYLVDTV